MKEGEHFRFLWGTSISSYQTEGGIANNDWNYFTSSKLVRERLSYITNSSILSKGNSHIMLQPAGEAVRFWNSSYYTKDFDIAKTFGLNTFRISLEWARIEPEKNQWNQEVIDHYKEMVKAMVERGLKPIITLNHLTLPLWISTPPTEFTKNIGDGILPPAFKRMPLSEPSATDQYWSSLGWENHRTVDEYAQFVSKVVPEFKQMVDYWITISEPVASIVGVGYIAGMWPPGFVLDGNRAKMALHNLIEAHVQAFNKITELDDIDADGDGYSKRVGIAHSMLEVQPAQPFRVFGKTIVDNTDSAKNFSYFMNDYFLNAIVYGEEDLNYLKRLQRHNQSSKNFIVHNEWKDKVDFIGINYYRRVYVHYSNVLALTSARFVGGVMVNDLHGFSQKQQPHGILNDLGWEIYPEGLYNILMSIKDQWNNKPILITENGIADSSDKLRAAYIVSHLEQMKRAMNNGANVQILSQV